jgi:hypothetical protein
VTVAGERPAVRDAGDDLEHHGADHGIEVARG